MRVRHSPCSWLKEIVAPDSVAGNTLIGMFTRLTFRKPFQVARAPMVLQAPGSGLQRLAGAHRLRFVAFVVDAEVEPGAEKVDFVLANLIAQ